MLEWIGVLISSRFEKVVQNFELKRIRGALKNHKLTTLGMNITSRNISRVLIFLHISLSKLIGSVV